MLCGMPHDFIVILSMTLYRFRCPPRVRSPVSSSPYNTALGMRSSAILTSCPDQRNCARVMPFCALRCRTSVFGIMSCHLMLAMRLKPGVHTNDFATIHGRPARIHTAPAESTVDSTYCLPQALCEYARGDRESWRNR